jgi:hypothetical protein
MEELVNVGSSNVWFHILKLCIFSFDVFKD